MLLPFCTEGLLAHNLRKIKVRNCLLLLVWLLSPNHVIISIKILTVIHSYKVLSLCRLYSKLFSLIGSFTPHEVGFNVISIL